MTDTQPKKPDLGLLEEDDEFEEFPADGDSIALCITIVGNYCLFIVNFF